jgi:hypothetical protein
MIGKQPSQSRVFSNLKISHLNIDSIMEGLIIERQIYML